MKKLAYIVIFSAILFPIGIVSAHDSNPHWGAIKGTYEMVATGNCIHSPSGSFSGSGTVADPFLPIGNTFAAPTIAQATWVFDGKGTATFVGENFATIFPGGSPAPAQERVNPIGSQATPFHFVYSITGKGWITGTVTEVPAYAEGYSTGDVGNLTLEGRVSEDHKIITLSNGNQIQFPGTASCAVCNVVRILYKVHD